MGAGASPCPPWNFLFIFHVEWCIFAHYFGIPILENFLFLSQVSQNSIVGINDGKGASPA
jgi:hypothetical protein